VAPHRQRQGIGTAMFEAVEAALRERGIPAVTAGYALPRYFLPGIDIHYTPAISFLYQRGYNTTRETRVNMDVVVAGRDWTTTAQEAALAAKGFTIRRGRAEDRAELERFCLAENHAGWAAESGMALERQPVTVHLALWAHAHPHRPARPRHRHRVAQALLGRLATPGPRARRDHLGRAHRFLRPHRRRHHWSRFLGL